MNRSPLRRFVANKVIRYRCEKYFWVAFVVPYEIFWSHSVMVVGVLSIYALVITAGGAEQAAEAAQLVLADKTEDGEL